MARDIAIDETGLKGRRLIIADDMPTSDSGNPQEDFSATSPSFQYTTPQVSSSISAFIAKTTPE